MALKNTNINEEYPYVYMTNQVIQQRIPNSASEPAQYFLSLLIKFYKIVDDVMVFDQDRQLTIDIDDFTASAIASMMAGDNTHINTLGAQQLSVKSLIEAQTGEEFEVV